MTRELLAKTRQWEKTRTGKFEITGFAATDDAVAREINSIFSNVVVTHVTRDRERFAAFLARAPQDRVFVGNFDNVVEFLGAVRRAAAGRRSIPSSESINRDAMPFINISRSFDADYDSNDNQRDRDDLADLYGSDGITPVAEVSATQVVLTYNVTLIAAEKSTLSLMCNTLASSMRWRESTSFTAIDRLVHLPVEIDCSFQDAKGIGYSDLSTPIMENRIFAAQATLTVMADMMTAFEVDAKQMRVNTYSGVEG
ncbi:baseplate [Citrobacter sp. NCU1]|uniref:baseplate n=1 Tax=Citrobacter sp. NCU1 TaxID=2026683 RepID=UPI001877C3AE|nr:baseplate [Citrobacter sp. NCU1]